jgi:hypothetical protein
MGAKRRFQRRAKLKLKQEPAVEDDGIALQDEESLEPIGATLDRLRQLYERVERRQLEPEDWALVRAIAQKML